MSELVSAWPAERWIARASGMRDKKYVYDGYAIIDKRHDFIALNVGSIIAPDTIDHEMYHLEDAATCGGYKAAYHDPQFASYNTGKEYKKYVLSYEDLENSLYNTSDEFYVTLNAHNKPLACKIANEQQRLLKQAPNVSILTKYSNENVVEDKAEMGLNIPNSASDTIFNRSLKRIHEKFTLLMARLAYYNPKLAGYFNRMARKFPNSALDPLNCNETLGPGH